ncbi:MAG: AAA family ATPase [Planctomycetota bacterium]
MGPDESIRSLRDAVRHSPDNVPLRTHLAELLLASGRAAEAEAEYRSALSFAPESDALKCGLARAFLEQGKRNEAMVVIEALLAQPDTPAAAYLVHARALMRAGDPGRAARQYRQAIELDPDLSDDELAEALGVTDEPDDFAEVVDGRQRSSSEGGGGAVEPTFERPRVTFAQVGGMEDLKKDIQKKIVLPLRHPEMFEAYGRAIGGGILLYGPPGCGKTLLARATAGEVKAGFINVGLHDVLEMWVGQSERNLHAIFDAARQRQPTVLFFDEVDALGARRTDMRQSAGRQLINQFLAEMDGADGSNEGVLTLAATNAPWHVDPAFRRPGRFDRLIFVPPPDEPARAQILRIELAGKPVRDVDHERIAKKTKGFSGADLKAIVDRAVDAKLDEALEAGAPVPLGTRDLLAAAKVVKPSTADWFATARNYALYANEGGLYDDILAYLDGGS